MEIPLLKIITAQVDIVVKFFTGAYEQGWMLYLIIGIVVLAVLVIWSN